MAKKKRNKKNKNQSIKKAKKSVKKKLKIRVKKRLHKKLVRNNKKTSRKLRKKIKRLHKLSKKAGKKKRSIRKNTGRSKNVKKIEKRVSTGVPNFDRLIGKGFEKNSANLLVGGSGSGKTIFATQFLIDGVKKGEKCLYVTFEEKKEQFYSNMKNFGWDLEEYEKKGMFTFL